MLSTRFSKWMASCCLAVLIALYVVGAVSHGSLRHEVQTLPLWIPIVLGFRGRDIAKWWAMPCLPFWLGIMAMIWAFLLGWPSPFSGHFSAVEVAMTIVVGVASAVGIWAGFRWHAKVGWPAGVSAVVLATVFQVAALRVSFLPNIADR